MGLTRITPPAVRFELHAYGEVYDFSLKSIDNWRDLEFTLKRDKTSGIFHQISFPFEFVLDAYDIVKNIFDTYKYRAKGDMYIYLLKDNWPYVEEQYFEPQIFNLDWTTYDKSDNKIEIDTKRTSLYDYIKAKNKIVYDIPVSEIKEDKQWNFERIELENILTMFVSTVFNYNVPGAAYAGLGVWYKLGITNKGSEIAVYDKLMVQTVADSVGPIYETTIDDWFLTTNDKQEENINLKISGNLLIPKLNIIDNWNELEKIYVGIFIKHPEGYLNADGFLGGIQITEPGTFENISYQFDIDLEFMKDDRLYFLILIDGKSSQSGHYIHVDFGDGFDFDFKVSYKATNNSESIDLIEPKTLLQSLVDNMTDSESVFKSDIEDFNTNRNNLIMMSAAESIRGITATSTTIGAEVHTSYRSFVEWMNTYGYEQHIEGNELRFRKRDKSFRKDLIAIELSEKECADLKEYVNTDYLYSGFKVGYNKKDIENINGRFEFNGIHDYSTDLNVVENILELISPYRADCYGIEFLSQERGKDSTDDKSDKDLFLVNVSEGEESFETVRSVFSGNYPNDTIFNGNLNPYHLMMLNQDLLGISVDKIQFTASDSNSQIVIDGQPINANHDIPAGVGLFDAHMYDIASKNIQHLPSGENANGIVRFRYKGEVYEGYIDEVSKNPAWESETTWILYKKK